MNTAIGHALCFLAATGLVGCQVAMDNSGSTALRGKAEEDPGQAPAGRTDIEKAEDFEELAGDGAWTLYQRHEVPYVNERDRRKVHFAIKKQMWTDKLADKQIKVLATPSVPVQIEARVHAWVCGEWTAEHECVTPKRALWELPGSSNWDTGGAVLHLGTASSHVLYRENWPGQIIEYFKPYDLPEGDHRAGYTMWKITVRVPVGRLPEELADVISCTADPDRDTLVFSTSAHAAAFMEWMRDEGHVATLWVNAKNVGGG